MTPIPVVDLYQNPDGSAQATVTFYALSLMAFRDAPYPFQIAQQASCSNSLSEADAEAEGLQQCAALWPSHEGWKHKVASKRITATFNIKGRVAE